MLYSMLYLSVTHCITCSSPALPPPAIVMPAVWLASPCVGRSPAKPPTLRCWSQGSLPVELPTVPRCSQLGSQHQQLCNMLYSQKRLYSMLHSPLTCSWVMLYSMLYSWFWLLVYTRVLVLYTSAIYPFDLFLGHAISCFFGYITPILYDIPRKRCIQLDRLVPVTALLTNLFEL